VGRRRGGSNECTGERAAEVDRADGDGSRDGRRGGEEEEEGAADFPSLHWGGVVVADADRGEEGRGAEGDCAMRPPMRVGAFLKPTPLFILVFCCLVAFCFIGLVDGVYLVEIRIKQVIMITILLQ
jgi:hypothetical protein